MQNEKLYAESRIYIQAFIDRARKAQKEYETGMGVTTDKTMKNKSKASIIWNSLRGEKSVGIIERDKENGIVKIAKPMGVVVSITPITNPVVTPMSNAMFALKGRNSIIITPHHRAMRTSTETVTLINRELEKINAPKNLIQILDMHSRENTKALISTADIVIATGGSSMVQAAYSSGRPALGVGAGNVQCIVDRSADYREAVPKIIQGRCFDNGIICSGEQSVILPEEQYEDIIDEFQKNGAVLISDPIKKKALRNCMFHDGKMNHQVIGQSAQVIAGMAGFDIPEKTKVIMMEADGCGDKDLLSKEKMCPVLSVYKYKKFEDAVDIAQANLELEGKGHSVSIHSNNNENIEYAGTRLCVSRFVINQSCAGSAGGSFYNGLTPTNTLGCGSWGHNSLSENLGYKHLINISRVAYYMPDNYVPTEEELWG